MHSYTGSSSAADQMSYIAEEIKNGLKITGIICIAFEILLYGLNNYKLINYVINLCTLFKPCAHACVSVTL